MSLSSDFLDLLHCPLSAEPLSLSENELLTDSGEHRYPIVGGVPWLLPHARNSVLDWAAKLNHFQQILLQEVSQLELDAKKAQGKSKERLQRLHAAKKSFLVEVTTLFEPLIQTKIAAKESYDALLDRAPASQNLLSYEANIYRDWVWGEEENKLSRDFVLSLFPPDTKKLCVLGAGACRLAYDIHLTLQPNISVVTDINPLFLLAVKKMMDGKEFNLTEFPLHPKNTESVAVGHEFKLPGDTAENFHLCFSDAAQAPFKPASFDTVLTPWLIDIQPHELSKFLKRLNHYLPVGGTWVNFGSLVFNQQRDALCYSIDEIKERAFESGFEIANIEQKDIPYLKSPYNAGYRVETVWAWRATKIKDVSCSESPQTLPAWILDPSLPIPRKQDITQAQIQYQFLAELYQRINGQRSISELAQYFATRQQADAAEFERILIDYFLREPQ